MNQLCCPIPRFTGSKLIFAALLVSATGCSKLAKVREVHQDLAIDRRGEVVVAPLTATSSLCDIQFDEGELEGSRNYFRRVARENLVHSLKDQIKVVHPKAVDEFIEKQGVEKDFHFDKRSAMKLARLMNAEIVVCSGYSKWYSMNLPPVIRYDRGPAQAHPRFCRPRYLFEALLRRLPSPSPWSP